MTDTIETKAKRILDKAQKLIAKANGTENEHEASAFMEAAMKMLAAHGLSSADIPDAERTDGFTTDIFVPRYAHEEWRQRLARAAAKVYMVKVITTKVLVPIRGGKEDWRTGWIVVGRPVNVSIFKEMVNYILETIMRLRKQAKHIKGTKAQHQFQIGAGLKVTARLREMFEEMIVEDVKAGSGNLPALYTNERSLIDEYIQKNMDTYKLKPRSVGADRANGALYEGFVKGDDVSLQTQVSGTDAESNKFLLSSG